MVGRHYHRLPPSGPTVDEVQGGITSLGQNRILAARTVIQCPGNQLRNNEGSDITTNKDTLLVAGGLLILSLLLTRSTQTA